MDYWFNFLYRSFTRSDPYTRVIHKAKPKLKMIRTIKQIVRGELLLQLIKILLLLISLLSWSSSSAIGGSPDEGYVLTSIWCEGTAKLSDAVIQVKDSNTCQGDKERPNRALVLALVAEPELCYLSESPTPKDQSAACQQKLQGVTISTPNFNVESESSLDVYPNSYFKTMRNFASNDVENGVKKIRFANSSLASALIFLSLSTLGSRGKEIGFAILAALAPTGMYFISSVNTSSWTLTGTICFIVSLLRVLESRGKSQEFYVAGLCLLISIWLVRSSRFEGIPVLLFFAFFLVGSLAFRKTHPIRNLIALVVLTSIFASLVRFMFTSTFAAVDIPLLFLSNLDEHFMQKDFSFILSNFFELPRFILGFFGSWGFGWFEIELPQLVWIFATQSTLMLICFSFGKSSKNQRHTFIILMTVLCGLILVVHQAQGTKIGSIIQPRYFLPFFFGIVIVAAAKKTERYPNSLVITVAILATISNSIALRATIRRYTTGQDVFISKSLNNPIEWWWQFGPQPETVWLAGTLAFAALWALLIYDRNKNEVDSANSPAPELAS